MRVLFSEQYRVACISIDQDDTADDVVRECRREGAMYNEGDGESFCVRFPGRWPELYTEEALRISIKRMNDPLTREPL